MLERRRLTKRFGGFTALNAVSFEVKQGRDPRADRAQRLGQDDVLQLHLRRARRPPRAPSASRTEIGGPHARTRSATAGVARTFQIPRPFRKLSILENVAVAAHFGAASAHDEARGAPARASEVLDAGRAARPIPRPRTSLLGAGGLKKLELARALATGPTLLLADESLGGLDPVGDGTAPRRCSGASAASSGVTIVWVEHIMATLMRVVDRVVVLDHGEKIAEGAAARGRRGPAASSRRTSARRSCSA